MSTQYVAFINDQEYGPVAFNVLETLAKSGRMDDATQVRASDSAVWASWSEVRGGVLEVERAQQIERTAWDISKSVAKRPRLELPKASAPFKASHVVDGVRRETAYPTLRNAFLIFMIIDVLAACATAAAIFVSPDHAGFFIIALAASLIGIIPLALANAFLDIADCALRKVQRAAPLE